MAFRIHFTPQDIARTRVAETPMPLLELDCAARTFQDRTRPAQLDSWRRRARELLTPEARLALSLIPGVGFSPSFLAPPDTGDPEELLEQVRSTPRATVRWEMAKLAESQPIPSWARSLADDAELLSRVSDGIRDLYDALLGPHWSRVADVFRADRAIRLRQLTAGGIERVLAEANPRWMRWKPPVLEVEMPNGIEWDLFLQGRGVLLVPSLFRRRTLVEEDGPAEVIVSYPVDPGQPLSGLTVVAPAPPAGPARSAVASLLGQTRAAVLGVIAGQPGCSTSELAALAGIAPASASEHATVLRNAGLIRTSRHRNAVLHSATDLGIALLNAPAHSA